MDTSINKLDPKLKYIFEIDSFAKPVKDIVSIIFGWDRELLWNQDAESTLHTVWDSSTSHRKDTDGRQGRASRQGSSFNKFLGYRRSWVDVH